MEKFIKAQEKKIYLAFEISIVLKGIHSVIEIVSGLALLFVSQQFITKIIYYLIQKEIVEDPSDFIATHLYVLAQDLTISSQYFAAYYLLSHGVVKFFLIINLLKKKLWAYPLALVVFGLFIVYQAYRYSITGSIFLIFLTILDLIVMVLTFHEYRYLKKMSSERLP